MQSSPDSEYRFIGHMVDHFSKFHIIFPMKSKTAKETTKNIVDKFFSIFGTPTILQSDNGTEFVNDVLKCMRVIWPGKCDIINGRPGHSQSQGLVEQGNNTIQWMINARERDEGTNEWSNWLPEIQCKYKLDVIWN